MNENEYRSIYRTSFCDPDTDFENLLFSNCFEYCREYTIDNKTVSMLFLLPIELTVNGKKINGSYLYAAATDPAHRKKGYMSALINRAITECNFILLRPAESSLIDYYCSFGFKTVTAGNFSNAPEVIPQGGYKRLTSKSKISDKNNEFTAMYYSKSDLKMDKINFHYSMI